MSPILRWVLAVVLAILFPILMVPLMVWRDRGYLWEEYREILLIAVTPWRVR